MGFMPAKKYIVTLTKEEKTVLKDIVSKGKHSAEKRKRAQALLLAEENYTDDMIADRAGLSRLLAKQAFPQREERLDTPYPMVA